MINIQIFLYTYHTREIMKNLTIEIPYTQTIELIIKFPLHELEEYTNLEDLDVFWDDNMMPIINQSIKNSGAMIQKTNVELVSTEKNIEGKVLYKISFIASPPNLNLEGIFDDLVKNNFPIPLQMDSVIESGKTLKLF